MAEKKDRKNSLITIIGTDIAGIVCLILVPILGPLPGPGGIPLLVSGLGLLALNHEFARKWLHYVKKHSQSVRDIVFPDVTWIKWFWDCTAVLALVIGTWINLAADWWLLRAFSVGVMASSTTLFMLNRNRITWFDNKIRRNKNR